MSNIAPGPWIVVNEGVPIIKRQIFADDGSHAGYELLDGDYTNLIEAQRVALEALQKALPVLEMLDIIGDAALAVGDAIAKAEGRL